MKISIVKYGFPNKDVILSLLSLVIIYLFIGFSAKIVSADHQDGKIFTSNHETISDEYNCDYFTIENFNSPLHSLKKKVNYSHKFTLDNTEDTQDVNRGNVNIDPDNNFIQFDLNKSVRNIFIKQSNSKIKLPTEKTLRSVILII